MTEVSMAVAVASAEAAALMTEEATALAQRAYRMRRGGKSYFQIAEALQLPEAQVARMVNSAIRAAADLVDIGARRELLLMELDRLDALQDAVWVNAMDGDEKSVETVLKIIDRRAKFLGLDSTIGQVSQINAVVVPSSSEEYAAALRAIAEGRM